MSDGLGRRTDEVERGDGAMLSRALGLIFCVVGLILPHRARIWFSEFLGWATQGVYFLYYGLMNYLLTELRQVDADRESASEPRDPDPDAGPASEERSSV